MAQVFHHQNEFIRGGLGENWHALRIPGWYTHRPTSQPTEWASSQRGRCVPKAFTASWKEGRKRERESRSALEPYKMLGMTSRSREFIKGVVGAYLPLKTSRAAKMLSWQEFYGPVPASIYYRAHFYTRAQNGHQFNMENSCLNSICPGANGLFYLGVGFLLGCRRRRCLVSCVPNCDNVQLPKQIVRIPLMKFALCS
jgi:hypothetical protein